MAIIGIVAVAQDLAIGKGGKLPWHYSSDLKFFKEMTTGKTVVMGANTWRSIGKPLPDRLNVVLTRTGDIDTPPAVMRLESKEEVIELSKLLNRDIYVIGGAKVFAEFADVIDKWIVTEIPETVRNGDVFMPGDFLDDFEIESVREIGDNLTVRTMRRRS